MENKKRPTDEDRAKMYSTYEFNEYGNRHVVTVSFELAYHDWLKLENSKEFRDLVDYLWELKTTDDRHAIREERG